MAHLRQIMLEELRRHNYAESTIDAYLYTVEHFSRHFHRSPDRLGPEHIRQYQAALFTGDSVQRADADFPRLAVRGPEARFVLLTSHRSSH